MVFPVSYEQTQQWSLSLLLKSATVIVPELNRSRALAEDEAAARTDILEFTSALIEKDAQPATGTIRPAVQTMSSRRSLLKSATAIRPFCCAKWFKPLEASDVSESTIAKISQQMNAGRSRDKEDRLGPHRESRQQWSFRR